VSGAWVGVGVGVVAAGLVGTTAAWGGAVVEEEEVLGRVVVEEGVLLLGCCSGVVKVDEDELLVS
jgi:hypothetical protein